MKLKPGFDAISILMGMLGLAACGQNSDQVVYQYPETAVLFDNFHILKTVYTLGEMKLYYRGMNLDGCQIECYDTIYRLRYLDSSQFAWLADTFWYDYGWMELGDAERYYSEAELQAQADKANEERQETLDLFALLEGTWVSEDGLQKYEFAVNEDKSGMECCNMWWNSDAQRWDCWSIFAKSAFQTKGFGALLAAGFDCDADCDYDEIAEKAEKLIAITLVNNDPAAADVQVLYDLDENVIRDTDAIYHKQ